MFAELGVDRDDFRAGRENFDVDQALYRILNQARSVARSIGGLGYFDENGPVRTRCHCGAGWAVAIGELLGRKLPVSGWDI